MAHTEVRAGSEVRSNPRRCTSILTGQQVCRRCAEICPRDAIEFNLEKRELGTTDDCDGCGLCVPACRSGAFTLDTEPQPVATVRDGRLRITCRVTASTPAATSIDCAGKIGRRRWLELALEHCTASSFEIHLGDCQRCMDRPVNEIVTAEAEAAASLLEILAPTAPRPRVCVFPAPAGNHGKERLSRRHLFNLVLAPGAKAAHAGVSAVGSAAQDANVSEAFPDSADDLTALIREVARQTEPQPGPERLVPLPVPEVDPNRCMLCVVCSRICPAEALVLDALDEPGEATLAVVHGRCNGCGLCVDTCRERAILRVQPEMSLERLVVMEQETLVSRQRQRCLECGSLEVGLDDGRCQLCRRQRLW